MNNLITADGIAGKVGEWYVFERIRKRTVCIVVYAKSTIYRTAMPEMKFKIQFFNNKGEFWKEFETEKDMEDFLKESKDKLLHNGKLYTRQEYYKLGLNSRYSDEQREEWIQSVLGGKSLNKTAKERKVSEITLLTLFRRRGIKFIKKYPNSNRFGNWVRS